MYFQVGDRYLLDGSMLSEGSPHVALDGTERDEAVVEVDTHRNTDSMSALVSWATGHEWIRDASVDVEGNTLSVTGWIGTGDGPRSAVRWRLARPTVKPLVKPRD